jgi:hypothetical protein
VSAGAGWADCIVVRERTPQYAPHVVIHFGVETTVPRDVQCATSLDDNAGSFCIPIYAYNLWEGATAFDLALRLPSPPTGFEAGPAIASATLEVAPGITDVVAGLRLECAAPVCGPVLLGCMRLDTADLPDDFRVAVEPHPETLRRAILDPDGTWRPLVVDAAGAHVARGAACPRAPCTADAPVANLAAEPGDEPGALDLEWTSGSGTYTLLCCRRDGRYPADPWDGDFLALLPSDVMRYAHRFEQAGPVHIAAWSVTRGPFGVLHAASNMECGALVVARVDLPVGVSARSWGQVKTSYR